MSCDWLGPDQTGHLWDLFGEWFGVPREHFAGLRLLRRGEGVYAVPEAAAGILDALHLRSAGLKLATVRKDGGYRPASRGIQVFGRGRQQPAFEVLSNFLLLLCGLDLRKTFEVGVGS